jgi:hypothetical protein
MGGKSGTVLAAPWIFEAKWCRVGKSPLFCILDQRSAKDPLPPATTGSFLAVQFNANQKPFVADFFVCFANDNSEDH